SRVGGRTAQRVKRHCGPRQEATTRRRERDPASPPHQQLRADLALEAAQPGGQRRLCEVERLRGPCDAATPLGLDERLDLSELHSGEYRKTLWNYSIDKLVLLLPSEQTLPESG